MWWAMTMSMSSVTVSMSSMAVSMSSVAVSMTMTFMTMSVIYFGLWSTLRRKVNDVFFKDLIFLDLCVGFF